MSVNTGGLEYEQIVWSALKSAEPLLANFEVVGSAPSGGFDSSSPDIILKVNGEKVLVEVKQNDKAQTGGTSARYNLDTGAVSIASEVNDADLEAIVNTALQSKQDAFREFIEFIKNHEPVSYHSRIAGFPLTVEKNAWTFAVKNGLLKPLNDNIVKDASFIANHYAKKGIYYIQIGGFGLFYLASNPLSLPIPKLEGKVIVELRAGRSGSRFISFENKQIKVAGAGVRLQGRMKFESSSPYILDDPESIVKLFGQIETN